MKILIDGLGLGPLGGARKSFLGWMTAISHSAPESHFDVYLSQPEPSLASCKNVSIHLVTLENRFLLRLWAQLNFPRITRKHRPDLFHAMKSLGTFGISSPNLITINDLNYLVLPELFSRVDRVYWRTVQAASIRQATHLIAISQNTLEDLIRYLKIPRQKITTIYPAAEEIFHPKSNVEVEAELRQRYNLRRPFILYVGGWAVHKNLTTLLSAYELFGNEFSHDLVIVGGRYHTSNSPMPMASRLNRRLNHHIHIIGVVSEADMPHLYRMADLFVMPSLNEGFGIALLEAMASGVPALASKCGGLPEVGGEAVRWISDPQDITAWKEGLISLVANANELQQRRKLGLSQATRFSWYHTGRATVSLYSALC